MKSVSIVIPNWNGKELLADYFGSVIAAAEHYRGESGAEVEVVVVDDASTDGGREWLRMNYGGHEIVKIIELANNVGFLRAVNKGFEAARFPVVFLLNNDVSVEPDCIAPLVKYFDNDGVFAVCCRADRINTDRLDGGGKIGTFERGFWRIFLNYDIVLSDRTPGSPDLISFFGSGGYTAYDREKLTILDGFQDCLAPNYWEDVEICYRAWKRGWTVKYEPASRVHHLGSASMKKSFKPRELVIVTERNRLIMTWINLHDRRWMANHIVWLSLKLLSSLISFRWRFIRAFFGAVSRISAIRIARKGERHAAKITDRELAAKFIKLVQRPEIHVVETYEDELKLAALKKSRSLEVQAGR